MQVLNSVAEHVVFDSPFLKIVSFSWSRESRFPDRDHGFAEVIVSIQEGDFEKNLQLGIKTEVSRVSAGQYFKPSKGSSYFLRCVSTKGVTLHVYLPTTPKPEQDERFYFSKDDFPDLSLTNEVNFDKLNTILEEIRLHSVTTDSPYFMNQLFSGILPQMLIAENLLSESKTTMATYEMSPVYSKIETEIINEVGALIGWEQEARDGAFVPGGSAANFMSLHCARHIRFPASREDGMYGRRCLVFVSDEAHYSFKKACSVLGIGVKGLVVVPTNSNGQMCVEALEQLLKDNQTLDSCPLLVCATSGTTVFGAFDPIDEIAAICMKYRTWLHVDAAWGGPVLFSKKHRAVTKGIELADSVTFDAHKLFGANLTCAIFLTRHRGLLLDANDVSGGDYLFHGRDSGQDRGRASWQCGRKADALSFWTIWKSVGTSGLGSFVDRLMEIRDRTVSWIEACPRLQLIGDPEFLNICFRVKPLDETIPIQEWTYTVRDALKKNNLAMINYSLDTEGCFLRMILAHPNLQFEHVKTVLERALDVR